MSKVLVVSVHMDDEVLGCGGSIARHVADGDHVSVCVVANRAYDHAYDADAIHQELLDCLDAQKILGYQQFLYRGLPDERLDRSQQDLIQELEVVFSAVEPEIVYIPWKGDTNQDHRAVFDAMMSVCRPYATPCLRTLLAYESGSGSSAHAPFCPNHYMDISGHIEAKMMALKCYRREARDFPHPRSPGAVAARAKTRGSECGLEAAEAFILLRSVAR